MCCRRRCAPAAIRRRCSADLQPLSQNFNPHCGSGRGHRYHALRISPFLPCSSASERSLRAIDFAFSQASLLGLEGGKRRGRALRPAPPSAPQGSHVRFLPMAFDPPAKPFTMRTIVEPDPHRSKANGFRCAKSKPTRVRARRHLSPLMEARPPRKSRSRSAGGNGSGCPSLASAPSRPRSIPAPGPARCTPIDIEPFRRARRALVRFELHPMQRSEA